MTLKLLELGYEVRAFGLPGSETKYITKPGVEIQFGDITNFEDVKKCIDGVDIIIHVAGDTVFGKNFMKGSVELM